VQVAEVPTRKVAQLIRMSPYCGIVGALLSDLVSRWWLLYGGRSKAPS